MKENKEKEVVGEENLPETQAQVHPLAGDKRKPLSKNLDIGRDPFAPYSKDLGNLRPEGTSLPFFFFLLTLCIYIYIYIY